jgi:hypothetical protein
MRWLEIIDVEPAGPKEKTRIIELCSKILIPRTARLTIYEESLNNELSIHILWESRSVPQGGRSELGRELSRVISDHGLVAHTFWVEGNRSKLREQLDHSVPEEGKS